MNSLGSVIYLRLKKTVAGVNMRDIVIVGGGPAGCFAGKLLAERGFDVAIIEEHAEIGHPVCCAGIVGVGGLKELGIKPGKWVLNELKGAIFHPPLGNPLTITRNKVEALVIDRASFDRKLAICAAKAGATFLMKTRCTDIKLGHEPSVKVEGTNGKSEIHGRLIIGADGPNSLVARRAGLLRAARHINCAQVEALADVDSNTAELYLSRAFAPGFFAWMVPAGDVCRVGLGASEGLPARSLLNFIENHPTASKKIRGKNLLHLTAGLIPEPLTRKIYSNHIMLVGDAAGHVKPLTGGGIYLGLSCARLAVDVATIALEGEPTAKALQSYEIAVRKKFGHEIELGLRARNLFKKLPDDTLDSIFELFTKPKVQALMLRHADFDHHDALIRGLLKSGPSLLRSLGLRKSLRHLRSLTSSK